MVTVRNASTREVWIKRGTPLAHVFPVTMVLQLSSNPQSEQSNLSPTCFDFGDSPMPEEAKQSLCEEMMQRKEVFSLHEWDVGCAKSTMHEIRLNDSRPFRERSRRLAPADWEDVRQHLQELKSAGMISESRSPYASPIVVVRKKSGKVRMCVDYRTLNQRTIPDQYTVPRIEDALHSLSGSKWFTVLDLRSGYYQIPMSGPDKEKTAFVCPLGFYEFERMPQGICGAPATFQRVMERTVGDMNFLEVLVYLDDLIVFGRTLEEHQQRLLKVLDRLRDEGLKISLDKCQFGRTSVNYVGHIVSQDGMSTDPSKIEAVMSWPKPQTVTELRAFLGFCGYYRRFVKDFSKLCRPLNELLQGYPSSNKKPISSPVCNAKPCFKVSEPFGSRWTDQCDAAFQRLKTCLTQAPVLAFADVQKPYILHVDASLDGLGGVLYQEHEKGLHPVAFISRSLSPSERNYPAHKLEFLALKWAIVDRLHDYLYGVQFEVRTDNNPLTYILKSAKLDATGHRWLSALTTYNFSLKYRPGQKNFDADALSRRPHTHPSVDDEWQEIPSAGVRALCQEMSVEKKTGCLSYPCVVQQIGAHMSAVPKAYCQATALVADHLPEFTSSELQAAQRKDVCLADVWEAVCHKKPASCIHHNHPEMKLLKREWEKLSVDNGLLYRTIKLSDQRVKRQLVLPKQYHSMVLKSLHNDIGHLGFDKSYSLVRDRFYWPRMKHDVEAYCKTCERCIKRKTLPQRAAPLSHMQSSGPMDLVCIDFLTIEADSRNVCNVLVVMDHCTRYAQAFPTRDQKASTVAKTLWEKYFVHYGLPTRIHSDQGRDFESRLVSDMLTMLNVKKSRTSPYHPQGDPQPERFNRTLLDMLGTLETSQKCQWGQHIAHLVHAYNCTVNEATGFSPYFLMFGREARLPVDVCFGVSPDNTSPVSYLKYVAKMKQELQAAYQLAQATAQKMNQSNKERYDQKVRYHSLNAGDRVLIRNLGLKGKQKLADRWSANPYVVESQFSGIPVYRLKPVDGDGPVKVLHRNHILPLGQAVRLRTQVDIRPTPSPRALRRRRAKQKRKTAESANSPLVVDSFPRECHSSDSESEFGCYVEDVADIPPRAEMQIETPVQDVECSESGDSHGDSEALIAPCQSETSAVQHEADVERVDVTDEMAVGHDNALQTPVTTDE
ncbi:interleukin-1 receptor accessory protein-like 1-A, partial [Pimephales promelas]